MERLVFQQIMQSTGIKKMENQVNFLKSVPLLSTFPTDILAKISDVLELEVYKKGKTLHSCFSINEWENLKIMNMYFLGQLI